MKIRIAQLNIEILNRGKYIEKLCENYLTDFDKADITVEVTKEEIAEEQTANFSADYCEAIAVYRKIGAFLPNFNGFILHAATFRYKDRVIALLAAPGTGKSTHMRNWVSLFGNEIEIINGDKPVVRLFDNIPFAFGTPWCGKEGLSKNVSAELTDICFIERGEENQTVRLKGEQIALRLLNQIAIPKGSANIVKTLDLVNLTLNNCRVWEIKCTADISSAVVSSKAILEEN